MTYYEEASKGAAVWSNLTYFDNALFVSPDLVSSDTTWASVDCAAACNADPSCTHWSWCSALEGCAILPFAGLFSATDLLPSQTCLLSYDGAANPLAVLTITGPSVEWVGGYWDPEGGSSSSSSSPSPNGQPTPNPSLPSSSDRCAVNTKSYTLLKPTDEAAEKLEGVESVESELGCCERCQGNPHCNFWQYCDDKAESCTEWSWAGESYSIDASDLRPGVCLLWHLPDLEATVVMSENAATSWSSGYRSSL